MLDEGWRTHSTNPVGVPTGLLASSVFNDHPLPLHIAGARETNPALFEILSQAGDAAQTAETFETYLQALFGGASRSGGSRRFRSSYRQLLQGWGHDANGQAGAALRMNNLVFFTADRGIADTLGDAIPTAQVPAVKALLFRNLLPAHPPGGEAEYLAIGGDYDIQPGCL